ncbi:MAG: type II toxin-antitoxin system HicB family antitoxin [Planctomycetota bacterium]|nr:type II toxin-antitoxin system HicB family antitoxin [Planctomycetota bacterium]MDI6788824.1 type II toxin-antitoxin system HicB family antitoxin [Planctomycetota bacterium]
MEYMIVIHKAEEGGYWSEVPGLPGCYSQGETIEETVTNTKDAIESHLAALKTEGQPIPQDDVMVLSHVKV